MKNTLKKGYQERQQQQQLKEQYGIEKDVVVVERKNAVAQTTRIVLSFCWTVLRVLAVILVAVLAIIGLAALLYPDVRGELLQVFTAILKELQQMTGISAG